MCDPENHYDPSDDDLVINECKKKSVTSDQFGSDEQEYEVLKSIESACDNEAVNYDDVYDKIKKLMPLKVL